MEFAVAGFNAKTPRAQRPDRKMEDGKMECEGEGHGLFLICGRLTGRDQERD